MYLLACGMRMSLRWIPSEWNSSDDASRGQVTAVGASPRANDQPVAFRPARGNVGGALSEEGDEEGEGLPDSKLKQPVADLETSRAKAGQRPGPEGPGL
eukprot:145922-Heterocapsa_arctica.AAC.1